MDGVCLQISTKSDVWSLGCILYSLVYNRTPFEAVRLPVLKLQAIVNPAHAIEFPSTQHPYVVDVLKVNLIVREFFVVYCAADTGEILKIH